MNGYRSRAYDGILLGHKKNGTMPFAAVCVQLEIIILREVSQEEKDMCHTIPHTCEVWKYDTNELAGKQEVSQTERTDMWLPRRWGEGWIRSQLLFFVEVEKSVLKLSWNLKGSRIAYTVLKKNKVRALSLPNLL